MKKELKKVLSDEIKLLTFRKFKLDTSVFKWYLAFGIGVTWLAGIGRYWDNPRADLWQYLGLGSVAYIFVLAFILWVMIMPLKPANWSYRNVLLFVSLTALPALLYAIPVERFMSLDSAQQANVWFLAVVALWRVALLVIYLHRVARLPVESVIVATLLPLTLIVTALTMLNLEHVVFNIMAGLSEHEPSANDSAYLILMLITWISVLLSPLLLILYFWCVFNPRAGEH